MPLTDQQLPTFVVFRYDLPRDAWTQVAATTAPDAGTAFRKVVIQPVENTMAPDIFGQYRVFPMEGSAHLAVELTLRDLDRPENPVPAR